MWSWSDPRDAARGDPLERGRVAGRVPVQRAGVKRQMKHFFILSGLLVAASVIAPVALMADDHHGERRYYDRDGRDYHYWNDGEDHQYRAYLVEQHRGRLTLESHLGVGTTATVWLPCSGKG